MKRLFKITIIFFFIFVTCGFLFNTLYKKFTFQSKKEFFRTETPKRRDIYKTIYANGTLEIKDIIKIGSLVAGTIKKIYVQENDKVKKGQILAIIDNGKEDTSVRIAQSDLNKAKLDFEYLEKNFPRQRKLFEQNQISKDFFEQVSRDYEKAKEDIKGKQAALEKEQIEFNNTRVYAPQDGVIVEVGITEGMKITTDLDATVLFQIATDITKMEATLEIDESDIGHIKIGQKALFTVGTYIDKIFKGIVTDVGYSAKTKNGILSYQATVEVDNTNQILRPGMTVNAKIKVAKAKNCLSISSQAFQINSKILKKISKQLNFKMILIDKEKKKNLEKNHVGSNSIKYVWIVQDQTFKEREIQTNITDDNHFEIKYGLSESDQVLIDLKEDDEMASLYKKMFKGVL